MTDEIRNIERELLEDFGTLTFSTLEPEGKGLGCHPVKDEKDWELEKLLSSHKRALAKTEGREMWPNPIQLDQSAEGACVGFGWTGWANARPRRHEFGDQHGFDVYNEAKKLDPWEGEDYSGTSVKAGALAMQARGHLENYAFTSNVNTLAAWVLNKGPAVIGVNWYTDMDRVDSSGYISVSGSLRGGHCVVIDGVDWGRANVPDRFRIRNSWGPNWGFNGRCYICSEGLARLFSESGNAFMAVEIA